MTDKLSLYNAALSHIGERKLASLTEEREPRYVLDDIFDDGAIDYCLEQGLWSFATRTLEKDYTPSVEPDFGYRRGFQKPTDWLRTVALATDEYFKTPLTEYADETGFWYADWDKIYARYVSNDPLFGGNYALWPETFKLFVTRWMAFQAAPRITSSKVSVDELEKKAEKALHNAKSNDGSAKPTTFLPTGSWAASRRRGITGSYYGRRFW